MFLFGSRARGTADQHSDWDVCLIGPNDPCDRRLTAADAAWSTPALEYLWLPRAVFDGPIHTASLEDDITRDGVVLAGDPSVMNQTTSRPFKLDDLVHALNQATLHLGQGAEARQSRDRIPDTDGFEQREYAADVNIASIEAAETLGRAACMLANVPHTGNHELVPNGEALCAKARSSPEPLELREAYEQMGRALLTMNGTAGRIRGVRYRVSAKSEPEPAATARLFTAIEADTRLRQGILEQSGPWAGLRTHPRAQEIRPARQRATQNRIGTVTEKAATLATTTTDPAQLRAVAAWQATYRRADATHQAEHGRTTDHAPTDTGPSIE